MRARLIVELNTILSLYTCVYFRQVNRDKYIPITVLKYTVEGQIYLNFMIPYMDTAWSHSVTATWPLYEVVVVLVL